LPGKPGLAGCPFDSQSLVILTGQAKTIRTHQPLLAVPRPLTLTAKIYPKGFASQSFYWLDALPVVQPTASKH